MKTLHLLCEYGGDGKLHGCGYIRLIHPLTHASVKDKVTVSIADYAHELPKQPVDAVIIERLVRPNLTYIAADYLLQQFAERDIPVLYTIDDNLIDLNRDPSIWHFPSEEHRMVFRLLASQARGVIVSTPLLAERMKRLNPNVTVVPNQMDERLFHPPKPLPRQEKLRLGYMGTATHIDDLLMILGPLRRFLSDYRDRVELELLGVAEPQHIKGLFGNLPVIHTLVPRKEMPYPRFAPWMQQQIQWDFAIAPLKRSAFSDCKSDLKMLDYGILGIPGIFSAVPSYADTVHHEENGLLATNDEESWYHALTRMTEDDVLRERLRKNVTDYSWNHRTLKQHATGWVDAVDGLLAA